MPASPSRPQPYRVWWLVFVVILAVLAIPFVLAGIRWVVGRIQAFNEQQSSLKSVQQSEAIRRAARRLSDSEAARAAAERSAPAKLAATTLRIALPLSPSEVTDLQSPTTANLL